MKKLLALFCLTLAVSVSAASGWKTDLPAALKEAKKDGKVVLVDFSGSDWCGWCIRLDKEVFNKPAFKKFAKKKLVLVMLDFPRNKPQTNKLKAANQRLAQKYGVRGFPTVLLLDATGKVLLKTGYQAGGPKKYIKHLEAKIPKK
jgi:thioredoxin-related protein